MKFHVKKQKKNPVAKNRKARVMRKEQKDDVNNK